jgi:hypothetical protein
MKKNIQFKIATCLLLMMGFISLSSAQTTFNGNGNGGFGDAIGSGNIVVSDTGAGGTVTFSVTKGSGDFNNTMVIYFDTDVDGRSVVDGTLNDQQDNNRRAISSAGADESTLNFPPGFEASHAIAVNTGFGGLWSFPATGQVGNNELVFESAVGNPANAQQGTFNLTFNWSDLGLSGGAADNLDFIVVYMNGGNGFLSNEGYGGGFDANNYGGNDATFTQYFRYQNNLSGSSVPQIGGIAETDLTPGVSGLYTDNSTWLNGNVPFDDDRVIIYGAVEIDTNVEIQDLQLVSNNAIPPSATVLLGSSLTVDGTVQTNGFNFQINGRLATITAVFDGEVVFNPTGILDILAGTTTFNDPIIFTADADNVSQIDQVTGTLIQNADGITEVYIPVATENTRAFRFISPSLNASGSVQNNWQSDFDGDDTVTTPGVGTQITGMGGAANGFDPSGSNNPSLFSFDNSFTGPDQSDAWEAVPNTFSTPSAGTPFRLYVRGDRNYDLTSSPAAAPNNDTRIRTSGTFATGDNLQVVSPIGGYFGFVGNPYQAIVDMSQITYANVSDDFIYVWDPNLGVAGTYVTVDISLGTSSPASSDANQFLMPGQAAFVVTENNGTAGVTFTESSKNVLVPSTNVFSAPIGESKLDIRIYTEERFATGKSESNAVGLRFDTTFSNSVDNMDAKIFNGPNENIFTKTNGSNLSIDRRSFPQGGDMVQLGMFGYSSADNVLYINRQNFISSNATPILVDQFLNVETVLEDGITTYDFSVDFANAGSISEDRFVIRFVDTTLSVAISTFDSLSLYPNPTSGSFTIDMGQVLGDKTITVFNSLGQKLSTTTTDARSYEFNDAALQSGMYLINISTGNESVTKKLIVR